MARQRGDSQAIVSTADARSHAGSPRPASSMSTKLTCNAGRCSTMTLDAVRLPWIQCCSVQRSSTSLAAARRSGEDSYASRTVAYPDPRPASLLEGIRCRGLSTTGRGASRAADRRVDIVCKMASAVPQAWQLAASSADVARQSSKIDSADRGSAQLTKPVPHNLSSTPIGGRFGAARQAGLLAASVRNRAPPC